MREKWKTNWTKKDRREYMALKRHISRATRATDADLRNNDDLRWLRWQIDAMTVRENLISQSYRSSLHSSVTYGEGIIYF